MSIQSRLTDIQDFKEEATRCLKCNIKTTYYKPYCKRHILELSYANEVAQNIEFDDAEQRAAYYGNWNQINVDGRTAVDILDRLSVLKYCAFRQLHDDLCYLTIHSYCLKLEEAGKLKVILTKNKKGKWIKYAQIPAYQEGQA